MKEQKLMTELSVKDLKSINGGYAPPTEEQMKVLRDKYGPLADFIFCW